jgi:perosamine synthetase
MPRNTHDIYCRSVTKIFSFLKKSDSIREAYLNAIEIDESGFLVPFCKRHLNDLNLFKNISDLILANKSCYPDEVTVKEENIKLWLEKLLTNIDDSILFLVEDNIGHLKGLVGFSNCQNKSLLMEVNFISSLDYSFDALFAKGIHQLLKWARITINCDGFITKKLKSATQTQEFYKNIGFSSQNIVNLSIDSSVPDGNNVEYLFYNENKKIGESLILTAGPSISQLESTYAFDAAANGWNNSWSKYLTLFENEFTKYVDAKYALATSSCTGALQIALMALDIGEGDEVIVPDQTWVATANAVRYVGATPVFADVELDSWNLDPSSVEALITDRTRAIMPVHMYGHPTRMTKILEIAKKYDLKIVEDAAPAIGAEWEGKRCGSFGDFAGFSFQGAKLLVTGEGGMLVTSNEELFLKAKKIWDQGRNANSSRAFWIDSEGVKFKMSNVQAAVGLGQLQRADELIEMKRRIFSWYEEELGDLDCLKLNKEVEGARSIYWMSSLFVKENAKCSRDEMMSSLKEKNIDTRPVFPAISQYPIWNTGQKPQPIATLIGDNSINLPSGVCLSHEEVKYVAKSIRSLV